MFKKIEIGDVVKFSTLDEYKMFFWIHPEYSFGKSVCFTADTKYVASSSKEVNWLDKWPYQASAATTYKMPKCDPWPAGYEPVFDLNAIRSAGMKYYSKSGSSWCDIESPGGKVMQDFLYIQPIHKPPVERMMEKGEFAHITSKKMFSNWLKINGNESLDGTSFSRISHEWNDGGSPFYIVCEGNFTYTQSEGQGGWIRKEFKEYVVPYSWKDNYENVKAKTVEQAEPAINQRPMTQPEYAGPTDKCQAEPKERPAKVAIGGKLIYGGYAFEVNSIVKHKADQRITIEAKYVDSAANAVKEVAMNTSPMRLFGSCVGAGQHCTSDWIVNAVKDAAKEARSEATLRFADVLEKKRKQRVADIAEAMIDALEELA